MILLVRHTRVDVPPGTIYGNSDVALAGSFETEAEVVSGKLAGLLENFSGSVTIHSSPLSRCTRLAEHIQGALSTPRNAMLRLQRPVNIDARLREMNFGDWENQTWSGISERGGKTWGDNWETQATPNGESFPQLYERARAFHEALTLRMTARKAPSVEIVVTHSGVIRCLYTQVNGLERREAFSISPDFGSVLMLQPPQAIMRE